MVDVATLAKMLTRVEYGPNCWIWHGQINSNGYGKFRNNYAHRIMYYAYNGLYHEQGLVLDHLCRNRRCVNPSHLELVTIGENVKRGFEFAKKKGQF